MESSKIMLLFFIPYFLGGSMANEYNVGGSEGWSTNIRNWSAGRTFQVGDVFTFGYDYRTDFVQQVNRDDYRLCFSLAPLATYKTGRDAITLSQPGEMYFISGNVQNCIAGEKLDIRVDDPRSFSNVPYYPYAPNGFPVRSASTTRGLGSSECLKMALFGLMLHVLVLPLFNVLSV